MDEQVSPEDAVIANTSTPCWAAPSSSSSLYITSSEEDLPKTTVVTQQTKALISRKPLPLPCGFGERRRQGKNRPRTVDLCVSGEEPPLAGPGLKASAALQLHGPPQSKPDGPQTGC
ncbi:unnamed protein product [Pleuronectes platessa]|uniref:Uncharacterized protein n=1 Tax=Pleuronectes platessa TaxID=8262 RepID=A0A9N7YZY6_PLEPL|nr:unnamed protein product [Pleuronectes platessa]